MFVHVMQCSQCQEAFLGTPTQGHQCYRVMSVSNMQCFDPMGQKECSPTQANATPLYANRTVFFAVQPKYLNVDIRIILDVAKGGLFPSNDVYIYNLVYHNQFSILCGVVICPCF